MATSQTAGGASLSVGRSEPTDNLLRPALLGAGFGVIASLVMALYAMMASLTYQGTGFFTPLYHIASLILSPQTLQTSMQQATMGGSSFYFSLAPALLGAAIHMMIGAMYGVMFGLVVGKLRWRGATVVVAGAIYGVMAFALSSWIALPIASSIFGSGDQIKNMAHIVGYGTFLVEHVLFGLSLGLLFAGRARPRD
jgi:hypothetical protein